jgi:hypothetical protein
MCLSQTRTADSDEFNPDSHIGCYFSVFEFCIFFAFNIDMATKRHKKHKSEISLAVYLIGYEIEIQEI